MKKFFINTAKIIGIGLVLLSIYCNFSTYTAAKTSYDYDGLNYIDGYVAGQSDCYDECYKNGYETCYVDDCKTGYNAGVNGRYEESVKQFYEFINHGKTWRNWLKAARRAPQFSKR